MAAGVEPQSSCNLKPGRPGPQLFPQAFFRHGVALAQQGDIDRARTSRASSIRARFQAPGVTVVARVPSAGPVPPPMMVVTPEARPRR